MSVETELRETFNEQRSDISDRERNVELIMYYFGFGEAPWPTMAQTGRYFGITRERVRQRIKDVFRGKIKATDLPALEDCRDLVRTKEFWTHSELTDEILKSGIAGDSFHIEGLFNLMKQVNLPNDYEVYSPDLVLLTRRKQGSAIERFVISGAVHRDLVALRNKAREVPDETGIAQFDSLDTSDLEDSALKPFLREVLMTGCWTHEEEDDLWYVFEEKKSNPLLTYCQRVFAWQKECDIQKLAMNLRNALRDRTRRYRPPLGVLEAFVRGGKWFESDGNRVGYKGPKTRQRSDMDKFVVEYFKYRQECSHGDLFEYMKEHLRGYTESRMKQYINSSPLIFVDKTEGRGHYRYSWIGWEGKDYGPQRDRFLKDGIEDDEDDEDGEFVNGRVLRTLNKLLSTDTRSEKVVRLEQHLLRRRLFGHQKKATCAICGEEYPVEALWVAHKKMRRDCTETERKNPNVVMPLCVFGCDFLYEHRYVRIVEGRVARGKPSPDAEVIQEYLEGLMGRRLEDRWLQGSEEYFAYGW